MTVTITSSLRVGLVSGTGVKFNAPVVPFITTDDVFLPDNPSESLTEVIDGVSSSRLLGVAAFDATTVGDIPVYAVPAGDVVFPTVVLFALIDIAGTGAIPQISVGYTSPAFSEIIDASRDATMFDGLTEAKQILSISDFTKTASNNGDDYKYISGGNQITIRVGVGATYSTYKLNAYVFGFQVDEPV